MLMKEIRELAKKLGLKPMAKLNKLNLIRLIQETEGNEICYASMHSTNCGQASCLWLSDCEKADR